MIGEFIGNLSLSQHMPYVHICIYIYTHSYIYLYVYALLSMPELQTATSLIGLR